MFSCNDREKEFCDAFRKASLEFGIEIEVLYGIARTESAFDPSAKSPSGAIGLMQIMPATGAWIAEMLSIKEYDESILYDPTVNVRFGAYYLHKLLLAFEDRWLVYASYNAGEGTVRSWLEDGLSSRDEIPYRETRIYVRRVERAVNHYKDKKMLGFN